MKRVARIAWTMMTAAAAATTLSLGGLRPILNPATECMINTRI